VGALLKTRRLGEVVSEVGCRCFAAGSTTEGVVVAGMVKGLVEGQSRTVVVDADAAADVLALEVLGEDGCWFVSC